MLKRLSIIGTVIALVALTAVSPGGRCEEGDRSSLQGGSCR